MTDLRPPRVLRVTASGALWDDAALAAWLVARDVAGRERNRLADERVAVVRLAERRSEPRG